MDRRHILPFKNMLTTLTQSKVENQDYFKEGLNKALEERFCVRYTGGMIVYKGETNYTLVLNLANQDNPLIIAGDFQTDEQFLNYIIQEMIERRMFMFSRFDRIDRVYGSH